MKQRKKANAPGEKDAGTRLMPVDVVPPAEIARLVEQVGIKKVNLSTTQTLTLGILAGAFIAFGAMFYTIVTTGSTLGFGPTRLLGGTAFSLGLVLVVVGGAELFTGNVLIVLAWMDKRISSAELLRNWGLVYIGNLIGALATVLLVHFSGTLELGQGTVSQTAQSMALAKVNLAAVPAFFRGVLCNTLVCLSVWMCFAAHSVAGKAVAIILPITAFVTLGFEHSVANMYIIPIAALQPGSTITASGFFGNLIPVTLGNIAGGGFLVALVYWLIYVWKEPA